MRRRGAVLIAILMVTPASPAAGIVAGTPAAPGAWPAMASVSAFGGHSCGGTLIHPEWVLSAAHCFHDPENPDEPPDPAIFGTFLGGRDLDAATYDDIESVVIHPGYYPLRSVNDLALLRLRTPSTAPVQPLARREEGSAWTPGSITTAIGYGVTSAESEEVSPRLLQVDIPVVSDADCDVDFGDVDDDRHLCAGIRGTESDPGGSACYGDSGGPLFSAPRQDGTRLQLGITSFGGPQCGVGLPGVWTEVAQYRGWIDQIVGGAPADTADPENPTPEELGAEAPIFRISDQTDTTKPIGQAVAASLVSFENESASLAVLARADVFADALGGSSLGFGLGPLLFTSQSNAIPAATRRELVRAVNPGSTVYILGGPAAVPAAIDAQVESLGFVPIRLAGGVREETAAAIADEVVARYGDGIDTPSFDTMILATSGNWPDAVTAGQIGSWWGIPVVLTPTESLHPATRDALARYRPERLLVMGGPAAISQAVESAAREAGRSTVERLAGADRMGTAAEALRVHLDLFDAVGFAPTFAVAVNLRRADAFAHVLSASVPTGLFAGVFIPVEGEGGEGLSPAMAEAACGLDIPLALAGSQDVIKDSAAELVRQALLGEDCSG